MITVLLQKIIDMLTDHFPAVITLLSKLNLIEEDTEEMRGNLDSMKTTLEDVDTQATTAAGKLTTIDTTLTATAGNVASIKNNSDAIKNNIITMSTNVGNVAAYAQDTANNTLDIDQKITSIASDTTQIRTNSNSIALNVGKIVEDMEYYFLNNIVTEEVSGDICNFDTDLKDYLQKCVVSIPADNTGFSGITITKKGKNYIDDSLTYQQTVNQVLIGQTVAQSSLLTLLKAGTYTVSSSTSKLVTMYYRHADGYVSLGANTAPRTFTITEDKCVCFYLYTSAGLTPSDVNWFLVECGDRATEYEAYKAINYSVSFGSTITDGAEVDLLEGIAKINTSPVSYLSFQPIAIRTYKGVNNIYADVGETTLTYRETLKHYLDKNN